MGKMIVLAAVMAAATPLSQAASIEAGKAKVAQVCAAFPENYRQGFVRYHAANFPESKQVKVYYANEVAIRAAKNGTRLPDGAIILSEIYTVKLDDKLELAKDARGIFVPNALVSHAVMARGACHKPQDEVNFLFTMKELTDAARR